MYRLLSSVTLFRSILLLALLIAAPFAHDLSAGVEQSVSSAEITGRIKIYGCEANPDYLVVRAVPLGVQLRNGRVRYSDALASERRGVVSSTSDPHLVSFSIRGLTAGSLYQLGVSAFRDLADLPDDHPLNDCRKMFWRGPERGLVVAGDRPVLIEGFVARTELEVRGLGPDGEDAWLGKDDLQFDDPVLAIRSFRWRSTLPGVLGAELQVSTEPFPTTGEFSNCDVPAAGLVARLSQEKRGNPAVFQETSPVDFRALLTGGRSVVRDDAAVDVDVDVVAPSESALALLDLGVPVYVRAVPVTAQGPACATDNDGVAGWVMMAKLPDDFQVPDPQVGQPAFEPWDGNEYMPPYWGQPASGHPAYGELAYVVIKDHALPTAQQMKDAKTGKDLSAPFFDPLGYLLVSTGFLKPGAVLTEGTWFYYKPAPTSSGGDFISDLSSSLSGLGGAFGGLVTATAGLAGSFVDYMHHLSDQIKTSLAQAVVEVASVLPGVSEICKDIAENTPSTCEDLVKQGIEYGLTSMGVPPSIPSWTELKQDGASYLAAQVSSAIGDPTGIAEELTEQELLAMVDHTTENQTAARGGDDPRYDWVQPYLGFEPAVWTLSIKKNVTGDLPKNLVLRIKPTGPFMGLSVRVPDRFPGESTLLKVPVVLPPNTSGIPAPRCTTSPFWETTCQPDPSLAEPLCIGQFYDSNGLQSFAYPCSGSNHVGIYYRDAWLQQKFFPASCVLMNAVSWTDAGGIYLLFQPPFKAAAALTPQISHAWNGATYSNCLP